MSSNGVVLLGCPRSGTTLLRRILGGHSNIASPGETGLLRAAARFLEKETTGAGVEIGVVTGLEFMGVPESEAVEAVRTMCLSFLDRYAQKNGKSRWIEKDAFNSFRIQEIDYIFGDSVKYVCIVRHGLDVACSLDEFCRKSGSYVLDIHDYIKRDNRPMDAFCQLWVDVNTSILELQKTKPEQVHLVKYEELVKNTDAELHKILDFLGEPPEDKLVERALSQAGEIGLSDWKTYTLKNVENSSVNRWKKLSEGEVGRLGSIVNPVLEKFNYECISVDSGSADEDANRRYQLGLLLNMAKQEKKPDS